MSMTLSYSFPENINVKSDGIRQEIPNSNGKLSQFVSIGNCRISMGDFCELVEYALTNTDLDETDDPRTLLIEHIKSCKVVDGYNKTFGLGDSKRIEIK